MPYLDKDKLIQDTEKAIKANNENRMAVVDREFIDLINDAHEEDVIPRAEHEEKIAVMYAEIQRLLKLNADIDGQRIKRAKEEVAREIFEEIQEDCFDQFGYFDYDAFAELKKKYLPKECPNCKHFVGCEPSTIGVCDEYKEEKK